MVQARSASLPLRLPLFARAVPKAVLVTIGGLLMMLCFPPFDMGWLIWIAPAPWFALALHGRGGIGGWAWLGGLMFFLPLLAWMRYFSPLGWLAASFGSALYIALFIWAAHHLVRRLPPYWAPPLLASVWVAVEWMRGSGALGLPWGQLSVSQYRYPTILQTLDFAGPFGLTWVIALVAGSIVSLTSHRHFTSGWRWLLAAVCLASVLAMRGNWLLQTAPQRLHSVARVAVVQASKASLDGPAVTVSASWQRYESLTRREASRGAALVVWPETAAPEDVVRKPAARQRAAKLAREAGVDILVGSFVRQQHGKQDTNSAVLFGQDGEIKGQYDKVSLVPFGEYLPLRPITRYLVPAGELSGDLKAGEEWKAVPWRKGRLGVVICFESAFPGPCRALVRDGSNLLAIITSDTWPQRLNAGRQHLAFAPLRAVETHRSVARAAATGVSTLIDPYGRMLDRLEAFEHGSLSKRLPLRDDLTYYTRYGDWPIWLSLLMLAAAVAVISLGGAKQPSAGGRTGQASSRSRSRS